MRYSFKVWSQQGEWHQLRDIWMEADRDAFWEAVWNNHHLYPSKGDRVRLTSEM